MVEAALVAEEVEWRAQVYGLLAVGYHRPPDDDQRGRLAACAEAAREAGFHLLGHNLAELEAQARATPAEAIRQDFHDLFMVPGAKYVTPYESVYRDAPLEADGRCTARTCGPSMQAVIGFYNRIGLRIDRGYTELPDYVGLELACMEYLCLREAEYGRAGSEDSTRQVRANAHAFLKDHLLPWIPDLGERIRAKAGTGYYRNMAAITRDWIRQEGDLLCRDI